MWISKVILKACVNILKYFYGTEFYKEFITREDLDKASEEYYRHELKQRTFNYRFQEEYWLILQKLAGYRLVPHRIPIQEWNYETGEMPTVYDMTDKPILKAIPYPYNHKEEIIEFYPDDIAKFLQSEEGLDGLG